MTTAHQIFPRQGSPARKRSSGPRPWELPEPSARRRLREQWDLTTQQVAAAFGVTPATVRSWERGRSTPRGERREAYRRFLAGLAQQGTTGSALPRAAVGGAASPAADDGRRHLPAATPAPSVSGASRPTPATPAAPAAPASPAAATAPAAPAAVTPSAGAVVAPSAAAPASGPVGLAGPAGPGPAARSTPAGPGRSAAPRRSADPLSPERLLRLRLLGAAACLVSLLWWLVLTCPPAP
ncbi:helix-turn-helix transcriptional regulator [Streptomyces sp. NPDC093224]|uniref:helix-turn-helix domain-containing protein n=1 Tax=Streptomyces sp. NPDC093224 TaxID=3155198 RepID=UPI00344A881D